MKIIDKISIRGARQHNLKNIDLDIPKNSLVVFTGVSGSGKSSLAFDTIYAEGQRRYVESLSSYARQFLGVMDKPDVDAIEGLSPAISIDQKSTSHNPRSTVGTVTEIYDYLRLLFARIGHPHCSLCGKEIARQSPQQIVDQAFSYIEAKIRVLGKKPLRILIYSQIVRDRKGEFKDLFQNLRAKGFSRLRIDGKTLSIKDDLFLIKTNKHTIDIEIDRLSIDKNILKSTERTREIRSRLSDSVERGLTLSEGIVILSDVEDPSFDFPEHPSKLIDHLYSVRFSCPNCNISIPEIEPRLFSFNSPHGACVKCSGIGSILKIDPEMVINNNLSIKEGGILPFARLILSDTWFGRILLQAAKSIGINIEKPLNATTIVQKKQLLYGTGDITHEVKGENRYGKTVTIFQDFKGVIPELERRFRETKSEYVQHEIGKYMKQETCSECNGNRLKKDALAVTVDGFSINNVCELSIQDALIWMTNLEDVINNRERIIGKLIIKEIITRLSFLTSVGLEYLTLGRSAVSLAGGEAQRIRLASQIGSGLSGVFYVLDEPSIGLHPRDNRKLIETLRKLKELGNTVVIVEHDKEMMEAADYIVDFGPSAGEHGGQIIAKGTPEEIKHSRSSTTGLFLSGKRKIVCSQQLESSKFNHSITIKKCSVNNLKNINASFPLHKLICVTGVSGSGKSSLIVDTLYHALQKQFNPYHRERGGMFEAISGIEYLKRVILIDQSPIGRTPRSNPATYTGAFTHIREIFSMTTEARAHGFLQGRFSFNVKGGRCEACEGEGQTKIEMQFLPDVYVTCEVCRGTRFNNETLEVRYKGKNISEVLEMTVEEALSFFASISPIANKLQTLHEVGLSYMHLGQPATQLSGGEAQRIKLATELSKRGTRNTLFILDEPTTGLHFADLEKLLYVLKQLVQLGNTVIVIEHNVDIIKNTDWVIDLGPEGGNNGGFIVAENTPKELSRIRQSHTGNILKEIFRNS